MSVSQQVSQSRPIDSYESSFENGCLNKKIPKQDVITTHVVQPPKHKSSFDIDEYIDTASYDGRQSTSLQEPIDIFPYV